MSDKLPAVAPEHLRRIGALLERLISGVNVHGDGWPYLARTKADIIAAAAAAAAAPAPASVKESLTVAASAATDHGPVYDRSVVVRMAAQFGMVWPEKPAELTE